MTVDSDNNMVYFKEFGPSKVTISFDKKCLDQLIPALQEINFWTKLEKGKETQ